MNPGATLLLLMNQAVTSASTGTASGSATVSGVGASTAAATGTATGSATVLGVSPGTADFSDPFTAANGTSLATYGNGWHVFDSTGSLTIQSNKLDLGSGSAATTAQAYNDTAPAFANGTVRATITAGDDTSVSLIFRWADHNNFYFVDFGFSSAVGGGAQTIAMYKMVAGSLSQVEPNIGTSSSAGFGDPILAEVEFSGTAIVVKVDGVAEATWSDSSLTAAGYCGVRNGSAGTGSRLVDDFEVDASSTVSSSTGTATGSATVAGVGGALAPSVGTATGSATVAGVGASLATSTGTASGSSSVSGVGNAGTEGSAIGTATGTATVSGVGRSIAASTGTATGSATVSGSSAFASSATGTASGSATVSGVSVVLAAATGTASGSAIVSGSGTSLGGGLVLAVGTASGSATVLGVSSCIVASTGTASGTCFVYGEIPAHLMPEDLAGAVELAYLAIPGIESLSTGIFNSTTVNEPTYPHVIFRLLGGSPIFTSSSSYWTDRRIRLDCFATRSSEARTLCEAVSAYFGGVGGIGGLSLKWRDGVTAPLREVSSQTAAEKVRAASSSRIFRGTVEFSAPARLGRPEEEP